MLLAAQEVNDAGGISGRPLALLVRDTAADPRRAVAAMDELAGLGVAAVAGEFHSTAARAAAGRAATLGVPFLCSSAVLDELTEQPTPWVARLAPPQSRGWRMFAEFLLGAGHHRVVVASQPSLYWAAGTRILRERFAADGGTIDEVDTSVASPVDVCEQVANNGATAALLLVGHPDPAVAIVRAIRRDPRLSRTLIGAPAGQPELPEWSDLLGSDGAAIPFLRYVPEHMGPLGKKVDSTLRLRLGGRPSFVAFEGYDAISVLAQMLRSTTDRRQLADSWSAVAVEGTRGLIRFSRTPRTALWQWVWPPIQISDRDPAHIDRLRNLRHDDAFTSTV